MFRNWVRPDFRENGFNRPDINNFHHFHSFHATSHHTRFRNFTDTLGKPLNNSNHLVRISRRSFAGQNVLTFARFADTADCWAGVQIFWTEDSDWTDLLYAHPPDLLYDFEFDRKFDRKFVRKFDRKQYKLLRRRLSTQFQWYIWLAERHCHGSFSHAGRIGIRFECFETSGEHVFNVDGAALCDWNYGLCLFSSSFVRMGSFWVHWGRFRVHDGLRTGWFFGMSDLCAETAERAPVLGHFREKIKIFMTFFQNHLLFGAVTPAVIVPAVEDLKNQGLAKTKTQKEIVNLIVAASSFDDVLAISAFNLILGVIISSSSENSDLNLTLLQKLWIFSKGPLFVILGLLTGYLFAIFLAQPMSKSKTLTIFTCLTLPFIFNQASIVLNMSSAGPIACIAFGLVVVINYSKVFHLAAKTLDTLWIALEPAMFVLIGAELDVMNVEGGLGKLFKAGGLLAVCLGLRTVVAFLIAKYNGKFSDRQSLFISLAWLPKATVQAAIGGTDGFWTTVWEIQKWTFWVFSNLTNSLVYRARTFPIQQLLRGIRLCQRRYCNDSRVIYTCNRSVGCIFDKIACSSIDIWERRQK